jgi:hypothetical protein
LKLNAQQFAYLVCRRCNNTRTRHVILFDGSARCLKHDSPLFRRKKRPTGREAVRMTRGAAE